MESMIIKRMHKRRRIRFRVGNSAYPELNGLIACATVVALVASIGVTHSWIAPSTAYAVQSEEQVASVVVGPFTLTKGKGLRQLRATASRRNGEGALLFDTVLSDRVVPDGLMSGKVRISDSDAITMRGRRRVNVHDLVIDFSKGRISGVVARKRMSIFKFRRRSIGLPADTPRIVSRPITPTFTEIARSTLRRKLKRKMSISPRAGTMTVQIGEYGAPPW
jgi:hypothetical protein